jgi:hypothetical protein
MLDAGRGTAPSGRPHGQRKGIAMTSDLTDAERDYLLRLLDMGHTELLRELHHASRRETKERIRRDLTLNEQVREKLAVRA